MDTIPRLETKRMNLRAVFPEDSPAVLALFSDPEVVRFYEFEPFQDLSQADQLISMFTQWFQNGQAIRWAMILKESRELIGTCCFDTFRTDYRSANLGYNVRSDFRGRGLATEAVRSIVDFGFEQGLVGPLNRVQALTVSENGESERVLEKVGFAWEGQMREYGFWKGKFHDMNRFGLLKTDWSNRFPAS